MKKVPWQQPIPPEALGRILRSVGLEPCDKYCEWRLLDFGCGFGRYLDLFANLFEKENMEGLEIDPEAIATTREKGYICHQLKTESPNLTFAETNAYDIVFSSNVIEHIPRTEYLEYLQEIHRILKPGGRFIVGTPNYPIKRLYDMKKAVTIPGLFKYYFLDDPGHCNKFSFRILEKDLERTFEEVHLWPTYIAGEKHLSILRKAAIRQKLRIFADKIMGYAVKEGAN